MFVVINLVFYFGFDSSNEAEKSVEVDEKIEFNVEEFLESEREVAISITP